MKHETFSHVTEAARWAASSVPEHLSARSIREPWLGAIVVLVAVLPLIWTPLAWLLVPCFLAVLTLRAAALIRWRDHHDPEPARWPRLTVLLPVYREPSVIPDLAAAMRALDYPSLEIVLLVEEDDNETRAALDFWPFQVLVVPDGRPRTKPRAVNYGLLHTRGEIVVVFDAEDRPAPDQPKRAVARMIESGAAVVQGVLACDHDGPLVTRLWALEYAVLFRGVLPFLSRFGLPFLLGGTTQYLRRDALLSVGAFDAHNVTEDADLAVRLARAGYTSSVVLSVTGEEAPVSVTAWVHQRARWLKGFIQTTLVHGLLPCSADRWSPPMRLRDRLALTVQLPVQLVCIASHPVGMAVAVNDPKGPLAMLLVSGYLLTIITFAVAARRIGRPIRDALALPLYSCLHTAALAIAVVELIVAGPTGARRPTALSERAALRRYACQRHMGRAKPETPHSASALPRSRAVRRAMTGATITSEAIAGGFLEEPLQSSHLHRPRTQMRFTKQRERGGNRRIRVMALAATLKNRIPGAREGQLEGRDFLQQLVPSRQIVGNDAGAVFDLGREVFQK